MTKVEMRKNIETLQKIAKRSSLIDIVGIIRTHYSTDIYVKLSHQKTSKITELFVDTVKELFPIEEDNAFYSMDYDEWNNSEKEYLLKVIFI